MRFEYGFKHGFDFGLSKRPLGRSLAGDAVSGERMAVVREETALPAFARATLQFRLGAGGDLLRVGAILFR